MIEQTPNPEAPVAIYNILKLLYDYYNETLLNYVEIPTKRLINVNTANCNFIMCTHGPSGELYLADIVEE